jgi:hypothetical protein
MALADRRSVPDRRDVPRKLYDTGLYDLKTHEGLGAFVDAVVSTLNGQDKNFGHLKKKSGQTQVHGHGEDATLYKLDDGTARAVDFVLGAGGPNPQPGWGADSFVYKHSDWLDPVEHGAGGNAGHVCPPVPTLYGYPDENTYWKKFQDRVKAAYNSVGRAFPDPGDMDSFRRFSRCGFDDRTQDANAMADKHIAELRAELGAPPE